MSRSYEDDDYPSIGDVRGRFVLVCHGDDRPSEWISWLEPLVCDIQKFINLSEEYGVPLKAANKSTQITSVFDFLDYIGIEIDSNPWTGSLISGTYQLGWIKKGEIRQSQSKAKKLLKEFDVLLNLKIRKMVLTDLKKITDLDEFLDRTTVDPKPLLQKIESQKINLLNIQNELNKRQVEVKILKADQSIKLSQDLLNLAAILVNKQRTSFIVGPFALWEDGNLYVLKIIGKSLLPSNKQFDHILQIATESKYQIIEVYEKTLIGGWISGPIYRNTGNEISKWIDAWKYDEKSNRQFETNPNGYSDIAVQIAESTFDKTL